MKAIPALLCLLGATVLLSGCFPKRDLAGMPGIGAITVTRGTDGSYVAIPPDCNTLLQPSGISSVNNPQPGIAFGCATLTNLSAQIADPRDLVAPDSYAGQQADTAGSAVTRYRQDKVIELKKTTSTSKTGSGN
ncbi:CpaD family pilus assembly lipoprotein [uncultured Castellaniella sp.]|uniref:CpaD family pilus assembly lipoprotein n=1 Tax=uncultured Castellaniella sp. TaxID=647907 RepID=UPI00261511B6|nr:CpaD family pilus assembly lipoprotein [uncultured Castellaniella sp.]